MSIKVRRGLLLVTITVVVVGALLLNVGVSSPTEAQSLESQQPLATLESGTAEVTTNQAAASGENGLIAFESNQVTHNPEGDYEIFAMNPDGTGLRNLTNNDINKPDTNPAWSADGRQIAFVCNGEICKMDADGSNQVQLTNDPARSYGNPTWSPDGTKIAYNDNDFNGPNIRVMNANGTGQTLLAARGTLPDWSPVNNQIVFVSHRDFNEEIYKMNADGSGQTRLTNDGPDQSDTAPAWSPDGNQIVFQSKGDPSRTGGAYEIYKMNADGSGETRLTANPWPPPHNGIYDFAPDWSPDGKQITFQANRTMDNGLFLNDEIFVMNADGSAQRNVTNNGWRDRNPDWQPLDTTGPDPVKGFAANAEGSKVSLSWTNPTDADFAVTRILRSTGGVASRPEPTEDQTQVYEGTATSHVDEGLTNGTTYHYTAFARDKAGNWSTAATASATIGPPPNDPPTLTLPEDKTVEATGPNGAELTYNATATDQEDGPLTPNCSPSSGSTFELGTTPVNCTVQDSGGRSASGSFEVTVEDATAPSLTVPSNTIVVEATGASGAAVDFADDVSASDAVDPNPSIECTPASGSTFALGTTTVSCTARDATGNESDEKTFDVKVQDTTAPAIDAHADITEEATGLDGATVNYTKPAANDAVDGSVNVNCTPDSGSTFSLSDTTVSCTATDRAGNSSQSTFKVTVEDTTGPTLDAHDDVSATATSSSGAVVNYTEPVASDAVDPSPVVTCSPAPGSTFPLGSTTVSCTAKDATGNESAAKTFKVTVAYSWSNFLQPINVTGAQSLFKIGSTVPVKFKLTGASAGIPDGNFYLKYIRTGNGDGLGDVETVATSTGTTGTQFRYDAAADQYIFNWSTKSISANQAGNYELRIYTDSAFKNLLGAVSIELKR